MPLLFNRFQTDIKLVEVEVVGEDSDIKTSIFFMDIRFFIIKNLIIEMDIFNPSLMKDQKFQFKVKSDFKTFLLPKPLS